MSNQRTNIPRQAPLAMFQAHKAESYSFLLSLPAAVAGVPQIVQGPNFRLPAGAQVTFRPTGPNGVNANPVFISDHYEKAQFSSTSSVLVMAPGADVVIPWSVDNLNELWLTAGASTGACNVLILVMVPAVQ